MVMDNRDALTFTPVDHPDPRVQRVGFDLTDPYVEQCWGPVIGPSATLLLRRMPTLWTERVPATITHGELARSLGLGAGAGPNSRLMHSIDRVVRYGLATWHEEGRSLDVYLQAPGLEPHRLDRLPEWTQRAHERLLGDHVKQIGGREETGPKVATITARLDRLQRARTIKPATPPAATRAIGR